MQGTRRDFVKLITAGGIALTLSRHGSGKRRRLPANRRPLPGRHELEPVRHGKGRIDGVAKVTGAKLYASDFRAADLPGWPAQTVACPARPRA